MLMVLFCNRYYVYTHCLLNSGNGKEILSMNKVIKYITTSYKPLVRKEDLKDVLSMTPLEWEKKRDKVLGKCRVKQC